MNAIETFISIILGLGGVIATISYLIGSGRRGQNEQSKAAGESNDILRGLIDDQKQEIALLRKRYHDIISQMTAVKLQVQILTDRRDYLETLVTNALNDHFRTDPAMAKAVKRIIGGSPEPVSPIEYQESLDDTLEK